MLFHFFTHKKRLDKDGNGQLDAADFKDDFAAIDAQKKRMYKIILEKFDFDDDRKISSTEFYDGFLLMAWIDSDIDANFQKQQLESQAGHRNLGNLFHDWVLNFNLALEQQIQKLGHELNQPQNETDHTQKSMAAKANQDCRFQSVIGIPRPVERLMTSFPEGLSHPLERDVSYRKKKRDDFY